MSVETSFVGLRLVPGDPAITPEMLAGVRDMFGGRPLTAATPEAALEAGGTALVLLRDPAQVLATALLSAPGAEAALHDWRQWAQALLRRRRQDRGRMHLVDIDLLADPETGGPDAAALGRLGALVGMAILRAPAVPMPGRAPDPVLALAEGLLARDRQDALLVAELEAETHRPAREADPFERVDRALSALRLAERERGLQRETMGLQVSEIERQARGLVAAKTEAQAQAARFAALEEELRAEIALRGALLAENERERGLQRETMGLQVSEIERQARGLVAAKTEAQAQAARFAALEEELRVEIALRGARLVELEAELALVYASTSWRATGPLRRLRRKRA